MRFDDSVVMVLTCLVEGIIDKKDAVDQIMDAAHNMCKDCQTKQVSKEARGNEAQRYIGTRN